MVDLLLVVNGVIGFGGAISSDYLYRQRLRRELMGEYFDEEERLSEEHLGRVRAGDRKLRKILGEEALGVIETEAYSDLQNPKPPQEITQLRQRYGERDRCLQYDIKIFGKWIPDPLLIPFRIFDKQRGPQSYPRLL